MVAVLADRFTGLWLTTVVDGIQPLAGSREVARPSRDVVITARQAITETWWRERRAEFELYISTLVGQEIGRGDTEAAERGLDAVENIPLLATSPEAQSLAEDLVAKGAVSANSEEDALHIGLAAAAGIEFLLTWNFQAHQQCPHQGGHHSNR